MTWINSMLSLMPYWYIFMCHRGILHYMIDMPILLSNPMYHAGNHFLGPGSPGQTPINMASSNYCRMDLWAPWWKTTRNGRVILHSEQSGSGRQLWHNLSHSIGWIVAIWCRGVGLRDYHLLVTVSNKFTNSKQQAKKYNCIYIGKLNQKNAQLGKKKIM